MNFCQNIFLQLLISDSDSHLFEDIITSRLFALRELVFKMHNATVTVGSS